MIASIAWVQSACYEHYRIGISRFIIIFISGNTWGHRKQYQMSLQIWNWYWIGQFIFLAEGALVCSSTLPARRHSNRKHIQQAQQHLLFIRFQQNALVKRDTHFIYYHETLYDFAKCVLSNSILGIQALRGWYRGADKSLARPGRK
jgi:hypothetical protein